MQLFEAWHILQGEIQGQTYYALPNSNQTWNNLTATNLTVGNATSKNGSVTINGNFNLNTSGDYKINGQNIVTADYIYICMIMFGELLKLMWDNQDTTLEQDKKIRIP